MKAGYCLPNPKEVSGGLTTTSTTTNESPRSAGYVASGNQINPMLKHLNKFWAMGFEY